MKFKDTKYGDLTGQVYSPDIVADSKDLTSLEGSPKEVNGGFFIDKNKLTSLKFFPEKVTGNIILDENPLESLVGLPSEIYDIYCNSTDIENLEGFPSKVLNGVDLSYNPNLVSLYTGIPLVDIKETLIIRNCPKLKNIREQVIEHRIKAYKYYTSEGNFFWEDIKEDFNAYKPLNDRVHSQGFRKLLGLKK